jgi:hypothetical protein
MPQLDIFIIPHILFHFSNIYFIILSFNYGEFLPRIASILKLRHKLLTVEPVTSFILFSEGPLEKNYKTYTQIIKKLSVYWISVLWVIVGIFIISFLFWNRFLRVRLPREIHEQPFGYSTLLVLFLAILFVYQAVTTLRKVLQIESVTFSYGLLNFRILYKLTEVISSISNSPTKVFELIYTYVYIRPLLDIMCNFGVYLHRKYLVLWYIGVFIIPQAIVTIIFFYEVTVYHHLVLFYKVIYLLGIPLIARVFLFVLQYDAERSIDYLSKYYIFTLIDPQNVYKVHVVDRPDIDPNLAEERTFFDISFCGHQWHKFQKCYRICNWINEHRENIYGPYTKLGSCSLFGLGFLIYFLICVGWYSPVLTALMVFVSTGHHYVTDSFSAFF